MTILLLQAASPAAPSPWVNMAPLLVILVLGYWLMFRPMMKEKKEKEAMRSGLKAGDRVLTIGGIHGTVTRLGERSVHVRIAQGVDVELARTAVAAILQPEDKE